MQEQLNSRRPGPGLLTGGFTLIELLVVIAIIGILAGIAVPNFLEAQTRARVARMKTDMRTLATALEAYQVDNQDYPLRRNTNIPDPKVFPKGSKWQAPEFKRQWQELAVLTTPVAYAEALPIDIFSRGVANRPYFIDYFDPAQTSYMIAWARGLTVQQFGEVLSTTNWAVLSVGPDGFIGLTAAGQPGDYPPQDAAAVNSLAEVYDATNGIKSIGNIWRFKTNEEPIWVIEGYPELTD